MQHDPELREAMTYVSPTSGERVGLSFIIPRTRERAGAAARDDAALGAGDLRHDGPLARLHERHLRRLGGGGRLTSRRAGPSSATTSARYYEHIRENDLTLTHALINLQRSRTVSGVFNLEEGTALHVVRETDAGIVVRGARVLATLGPLADEIAVYSPRLAQHDRDRTARSP